MELLLLKRKEGISTCAETIVIHDELIVGMLGELFAVSVFNGLQPLTVLIDMYEFPDSKYRCLPFLSGYRKYLYDRITFYKDESFNA